MYIFAFSTPSHNHISLRIFPSVFLLKFSNDKFSMLYLFENLFSSFLRDIFLRYRIPGRLIFGILNNLASCLPNVIFFFWEPGYCYYRSLKLFIFLCFQVSSINLLFSNLTIFCLYFTKTLNLSWCILSVLEKSSQSF